VAAVLLALLTAVAYGMANYLGPLLSRRLPLAGVLLVGQTASLVGAAAFVAVVGGSTDRAGLALGVAAGVANGIALASFYRAAAMGPLSVVAPIGSTGAVVPVVASIAFGERPSVLQLVGIPVAVLGVALAASKAAAGPSEPHEPRSGVRLAVFSAVAFGGFLAIFAAAADHGSAVALLSSRAALLVCTVAVVVVARLPSGVPRRDWAATAVPGLLLVIGTAAYGVATTKGLVSVVSVLATLSPVVTITLAVLLLGERLVGRQRAGVVVALLGVIVLAAG
jgi:drug/metabolite transporter (DMT)-like permease